MRRRVDELALHQQAVNDVEAELRRTNNEGGGRHGADPGGAPRQGRRASRHGEKKVRGRSTRSTSSTAPRGTLVTVGHWTLWSAPSPHGEAEASVSIQLRKAEMEGVTEVVTGRARVEYKWSGLSPAWKEAFIEP